MRVKVTSVGVTVVQLRHYALLLLMFGMEEKCSYARFSGASSSHNNWCTVSRCGGDCKTLLLCLSNSLISLTYRRG